ncbi:disks large homolog 5-like isoform X1 [Mesocricetus auratus]|uniref:Disks large homolog 5-like isoform X1 n=1 Tax=Mesocricetus auratus TaxID=10036 RepID=A0ABM2X282_MESAU|nr:disks large homolog 5-like isoform X1 [Mesocricetus auratus]
MNMLESLGNLLRRQYGEDKQTRERQKKADFQPHFKGSRKKWFKRKNRAAVEPSTTSSLVTKKEMNEKMEGMSKQLDQLAMETKELRDCLISITEGCPDDRSMPYHRPKPFYENLQMEHKQVMDDLQRLQNENKEALERFYEITEESLFYCNLQQQLQMEKSQVQYVVEKLRQETKKVLGEWILLQYYLDELKVICEKEERVIRDLQTQEHQEQQRQEGNLQNQKKEELIIEKKTLAGKLQDYLTVSQMRSEKLQQEIEQASGHDESTLQTELQLHEH